MKNILVVGGAGYVGGALTDLMLEGEDEFRVYDALIFENEYHKPIDFIFGDIRDDARLIPHLQWADTVVWLSALVADGACDLYPEVAAELNERRVRWLTEHFHGRIIFPSTCLVYKILDAELTEESATDPRSIYTKTKCAAETILKNQNALVFRLSTLFGLGDRYSRPRLDLVTNLLTARAVVDKKMTVFGGGQSRPFLHVRDAAQAIQIAIHSDATGAFNIHMENSTILDLARAIQRHVPEATIDIQKQSVDETGDYRISSKKARTVLGFSPRYRLDDGIEEIKEFISSCRLKDIRNARYNNALYLKAHDYSSLCPRL